MLELLASVAVASGAAGDAAVPPCAVSDPPAYYAISLHPTRRVPGTARARGEGVVTFAPSPFGVSLTPDGSYRYDVSIRLDNLPPPRAGVLVAWATTPELDQIVTLGPLDEALTAEGTVAWNKFLLVISLEAAFDPDAPRWSGPIVLRGLSRSGLMHTMAGHGPFQRENCASYGFGG